MACDISSGADTTKQIAILILVNTILLFCLGSTVFFDFLTAVERWSAHPDIWLGNHSIKSFTTLFGMSSELIYGLVGLCLIVAYLNKNLLLPLTIGAMLIPAISHDYKLAILVLPVALAATNKFGIAIVFLFCITLFSYVTKPMFLLNNAPVLLGILIVSSLVGYSRQGHKTEKPSVYVESKGL